MAQLADGVLPSRPFSTLAVAASSVLVRQNVILPVLHGLAPEEVVELVAAGVLIRPLSDGVKHVLLDLDALVADGWVVEGSQDVIDNFVDRDAGVLPGVEYATVN